MICVIRSSDSVSPKTARKMVMAAKRNSACDIGRVKDSGAVVVDMVGADMLGMVCGWVSEVG